MSLSRVKAIVLFPRFLKWDSRPRILLKNQFKNPKKHGLKQPVYSLTHCDEKKGKKKKSADSGQHETQPQSQQQSTPNAPIVE